MGSPRVWSLMSKKLVAGLSDRPSQTEWTYGYIVCYGRRLRSFKVIELSTHRKLVCEFLSVAHSNLCRFYPPKVIPWEHTVWNLMSKPGLSVLYPTVKIAWSFYDRFSRLDTNVGRRTDRRTNTSQIDALCQFLLVSWWSWRSGWNCNSCAAYKKLSCRRDMHATLRVGLVEYFTKSLKGHSRSFEMTPLSRA